jgi:hypothetical protein
MNKPLKTFASRRPERGKMQSRVYRSARGKAEAVSPSPCKMHLTPRECGLHSPKIWQEKILEVEDQTGEEVALLLRKDQR